jgi:hypothetical protein
MEGFVSAQAAEGQGFDQLESEPASYKNEVVQPSTLGGYFWTSLSEF